MGISFPVYAQTLREPGTSGIGYMWQGPLALSMEDWAPCVGYGWLGTLVWAKGSVCVCGGDAKCNTVHLA